LLREVIEWATDAGRGKVVALVLMGGQYFSNGIALNTIEHAARNARSPEEADLLAGKETWANINAIDDVVELLAGDTHPDRSPFLKGKETLVQKGIATIAVLRGNAAAGGVALAAACDMVLASENVVINPAYRAMGLLGSELHS
jgi:enoyl-CoA hydratase/carnithine racemase